MGQYWYITSSLGGVELRNAGIVARIVGALVLVLSLLSISAGESQRTSQVTLSAVLWGVSSLLVLAGLRVLVVQTRTKQSETFRSPAKTKQTSSLSWQQVFSRRLLFLDAVVMSWSISGFLLVAKALTQQKLQLLSSNNLIAACIVLICWMALLSFSGSRSSEVYGGGAQEYQRVIWGTVWLIGLLGLFSVFFKVNVSAWFLLFLVLVALPVLLFSRHLLRLWLVHKREQGGFYCSQVVIWGTDVSGRAVAKQLLQAKSHGYDILGIVSPEVETQAETGEVRIDLIPHYSFPNPVEALRTLGGDTLVLTGTEGDNTRLLRDLGWSLDPEKETLIIAETLSGISGPRVQVQHLPNLSLVSVSAPTYAGASRLTKRLTDVFLSSIGILIFAIPMVAIAIAIKSDSPGPVFFRQQRIGAQAVPFKIYKFRTMRIGAEAELDRLLESKGIEMTPFVKVTEDPRITKLGAWLRKTSLDEVPQLFNVFLGQMSLVGPRPQTQKEVDLYDDYVARRLLVKPGLSGLWQVEGRSDLSPEEGLKLDLYYVENWSLTQDLMIIFKTFRAVFAREGAV